MSADFIARLVGMVAFAVGGLYLGANLGQQAGAAANMRVVWAAVFALEGALFGLVTTPFLTTRPARALRAKLGQVPASTLVSAVIGLLLGLVIAALLAWPLSFLPSPLGEALPLAAVVIFSWLGVTLFSMRQRDIFGLFLGRLFGRAAEASPSPSNGRSALLDTSAIIDGRIADITQTGFVSGEILVPHFVLSELQHIADSPDNLRRNRGRRGLEILNRLQKDSSVPVRITDVDVEGVREVDDKLVVLARQNHWSIITNDYNLNRVAELQGVVVLNINELANAVKSILLPGESLSVRIIQEGKEYGQGVGYLDDGTMVVVEDGRDRQNQLVTVTVTKVLQTAAGRMIFARPE